MKDNSFARNLQRDELLQCTKFRELIFKILCNIQLRLKNCKKNSKKTGALIRSMKFLSPEAALYLCKSTKRPYMEYCCHGCVAVPSSYLELLDKLQKWICKTVGPSLDASLELLSYCSNLASLILFYRYYFGRCSSELDHLVPLSYFRRRSFRYSDRVHNFSVTIPRRYKDFYVNGFFPLQNWTLEFSVYAMISFDL